MYIYILFHIVYLVCSYRLTNNISLRTPRLLLRQQIKSLLSKQFRKEDFCFGRRDNETNETGTKC